MSENCHQYLTRRFAAFPRTMVSTSRRRCFRFSLRSSLVAMVVLASILSLVANCLHVHDAEQRVADEIRNSGGYVEQMLFGLVSTDDPDRWEGGPEWLQRVVFVRLAGTDIDDERLSRLELQRLKHLHELSIGYDAIFGIDGPKWEFLPAPITGKGLAALPPFPKLRSLNLCDLPVGDAGLRGLSRKYPLLEHIYLGGTHVTDLSMAEVGQLHKVKELHLQKTLVTDSGLAHLGALRDLQVLNLSETRVVGSGLEHLAPLTKLVVLDLRETRVSNDHARHLARLRQLHSLVLWGTDIGDAGVGELARLRELTYLNLSDTALTDAGVKFLVQLPRLDDVSLCGTAVTDEGLRELAKMPEMNHISLYGTNVTISGVADFLCRKPDRTVLYNNRILYVTDLVNTAGAFFDKSSYLPVQLGPRRGIRK